MGKQVNQYDKIFRENIEAVIPGLLENVLGISATETEELPDDIQHTKERKPDVLKKITDSSGNVFVLQIEFQVADEPDMIYRMLDYCAMLERKYKLPMKQFVIYIGPDTPAMKTRLDRDYLTFQYALIAFSELDYQTFLRSDKPEEVVLGILAGFGGANAERAVRQIVQRIEETATGELALKRYVNQLRVLAQLRNLELTLETAMDSIAKYISEEKDVFYLRGFHKGEARGETKGELKAEERIVQNLLTKMSMSVAQVADVAGVSVAFVEQIRQKMDMGQ